MESEKKWMNWWFEVVGEDSDLYGEEFFVAVEVNEEPVIFDEEYTLAKKKAVKIAKDNFPNEKLKCYGWVSDETAEEMGLDTY